MDLGLGYSVLMAIKVVVVFSFIYFFIPAQIIRFRDDETFLDRVFISLVHSNFITIIIVHILAFLKLYETFSLLFCYLATYVMIAFVKGRSPAAIADAIGMKVVINLLDMSEGRSGLKGELAARFQKWLLQVSNIVVKMIKGVYLNPFTGLIPVVTLVAAAGLRFNHSLIHAYLGASDSYVHLAMIKYLGVNQIYRDGIWPHGYHAIISALNKLVLIDPYFLVRFAGPLAGFLIVLSVYYFAIKNFNSPYVALLAVFVYGLVTDGRFPSMIGRQISALPQEYAMIFLLPGLHFLNLYMKEKTNSYLLLAAECLAITLFIHPYVTVIASLGYFVMLLCYPDNILKPKFFTRLVAVMLAAYVLSFAPMAIGLLFGNKFHHAIGNVQLPSVADGNNHSSANVFIDNAFLTMLLFGASIIILYGLFLALKGNRVKENNRIYLFLGIISMIFYFTSKTLSFNLELSLRIGIFTALFAVFSCAGIMDITDLFVKSNIIRNNIKSLFTITASIAILVLLPIKVPTGLSYEYDEAANAYLKIKNRYPPLNWTIIAPVEQYQQTLNYGWHYELLDFAKKISDAGKPAGENNFSIPTDYIFIFTEKIPLGSDRTIELGDLEKKIPELKGRETEFYYRDAENRRIIQAKVYYWAENYIKSNSDMEVFYEGDHLKIYLIKQDYKTPVNLLSNVTS